MNFGIHTNLWISVFFVCSCEAEYEIFNWTELLPYSTILCHGTDGCNEPTRNLLPNASGQVTNPCCKECDCGHDCSEESYIETYSGMTECIHFEDGNSPDILEFKFVVAEPKDGCRGASSSFVGEKPSCGTSVLAAPWGNLYPVYSYDTGMNFKNRKCALCHGAKNLTKWFAYGLFKSQELYRMNKIDYFDWSDVVVKFLPPTKESVIEENVCYNVIKNCSVDVMDTFHIPGAINMTRKQVIKACEDGRISFYHFSQNKKFKNVFCALCNDFVDRIEDTIKCESGLGIRDFIDIDSGRPSVSNFNRPFSFLIDNTVKQAGVQVSRGNPKKRIACFPKDKEKKIAEGNTCRDVLCPTLQIRLSDGTCGFPMEDMYFTKIYLFLNLTCDGLIDEQSLTFMSKPELETMFKRSMPWPRNWQIISVLMRNDKLNNNMTELVAVVGTMFFEYVPVTIVKESIEDSLSNEWVIDFERNLSCVQKFHIHGDFDQIIVGNESTRISMPRWSLRHKDNTLFSNLSSPTWKVLLSNVVPFFLDPPSDDMEINQLFFCDQIELQADEFIEVSQHLPVYLKHQEKFLYPSQYHMFTGDDGKQVIVICLEDSDLVLFDESYSGTFPVITPGIFIFVTELMIFDTATF